MKKLKQTMKRIATFGLTAALLVNTVPLDAFAADPAGAGGEVSIEAEASYPAFVQSETVDGVKITIGAEEGVFPEGAVLSAEKVTKAQEEQAQEAVESERDENQNVAASYTYDIKVLDKDGNEIQPADESRVKLSFKLEEVADSNLETNIYHIRETDPDGTDPGEKAGDDRNCSEETTEGNDTTSGNEESDNKESDNKELIAEKLEVETDGDTATAETDGFSLYIVEFTYNDKQYVMSGDSEITVTYINGTLAGSGTEADPYVIADIDDWKAFASNVKKGNNYGGKFVELGADLDFTNVSVTTISAAESYMVGKDGNAFSGTFNGKDHKICNFTITGADNFPSEFGFFYGNNGGSIKNTVFENCTIRAASYGGIVASGNYNGGTIENCRVSGTIIASASSGGTLGGIASKNFNGYIKSCAVKVVLRTNSNEYGFVCGRENIGNGSVTDTYYTSDSQVTRVDGETERTQIFVYGAPVYRLIPEDGITLTPTTDTVAVFDGTKYYAADTEVTFTASVEDGKTADPLYCNGEAVSKNNGSYTCTVTDRDVTVQTIESLPEHSITVSQAAGGSMSAGATAHEHQAVSLTAMPDNGYLLNGVKVKDGSGSDVEATCAPWYASGDSANKATFHMPASDVTVTPVFSAKTDTDAFSVRIPKTDTETVVIPDGVAAFKVYDHAGPDRNYGPYCSGKLVLTAPQGCGFQIAGNLDHEGNKNGDENFTVSYGGGSKSWDHRVDIDPVIINSNTLILEFISDDNSYHNSHAGLDLTVTMVDFSIEHTVTISSQSNGTMTAETETAAAAASIGAAAGTTVTIKAYPSGGYMLKSVTASYMENGVSKEIPVSGGWRTGNVMTMTMPYADVTVTPVFAEGNADGGPKIDGLNYVGTDGSDHGYYAVDSPEALNALAAYVNAGNSTWNMLFKQTADIDMQNMGYSPIGCRAICPFNGTYDGNGFVILNISHDGSITDGYSALFGRIVGATVKNVNMKDCSFTGSSAGGIAASLGSGTIENCSVLGGSIQSKTTEGCSGGIVGNISGGDIKNCFTDTTVGCKAGTVDKAANGPLIGVGSSSLVKNSYYTNSVVDGKDEGTKVSVYTVMLNDDVMPGSGMFRTIGRTDEHTWNLSRPGDSITLTAELPASGMKRFTTTAGTLAGTTTAGAVTLTMPAEDVTVGLESVTPTITVAEVTYTGSALTPTVTVKDGDTTLDADTDYTVNFTNNNDAALSTSANPPTATIMGKGVYFGKITETFTINKKSITPVVSITGWTYGDTPNSPSLTAESNPGGGTVKYQYRLNANGAGAFSDVVPTNASHVAYTVQATIAETANYKGGTATATFKIEKKPVTITGFSVSDKIYNGTTDAAVTGMAVINGLVGNDDITVTAGTAAFADKNVGTDKTVTFSGFYLSGESINNYMLSAQPTSVTADITPKPVTITGLTVTGKTYDGTTDATVDCSEAIFAGKVEGDSLSVSGVTGIFADKNAASGKTVTLNYGNAVLGGTDADNYIIAESGNQSEAAAAITKKTASAVSEISRTYLYTAGGQGSIDIAALLPTDCGTNTYTVTKSGSVTYSADPAVADGILTYTVAPGTKDTTGTITVKAETLNYTDITITVNVKLTDQKPVELKDGTSVVLNKSTLTYGEALSALTFKTDTAVFVEQGNTSNVIAGSLSWKTATAVPAAGTTSATWVFTPADAAYAAFEGTVAITVNKATPLVMTEPTVSAITYGQTLADSTLAEGIVKVGDTAIEGTFAWKTGTVKPSVSDSGKTLYDVVFTPSDTTNYETAECKVKITVNKANPTVTAPTAKTGLGYTGIAQTLVTQGSTNGGTLQYALGENKTTAPTSGWSDKVPTGIKAGTYYLWYKVVEDENYNGSTPGCVEATITPAANGSDTIPTVEVQRGTDVEVELNLKAYIGANATSASFEEHGNSDISFSSEDLSGSILTFKVTSQNGGTGSIDLTVSTENYTSYKLTIPVIAKAKTTVVKLDDTSGGQTAVEGVDVSGLDVYTNNQNGTSVKVELDVKTESEVSVGTTVANMIKGAVALIFFGVDSSSVGKEYLDISVKKTVDGTTSSVTDVGSVVEIAVKYDLTGKYNPVVIREHDGSITKFTALSSKPTSGYTDGTFYVDAATGTIYIYSKLFSTYSIAYATTASYTVKFDAQGGTSVDPVVVKSGGVINPLPEPTRSGYSFNGWYNGSTKWTTGTAVTGNMTLTASWTQNGGGGTGGGSGGGGGGTPTPTTYTVSFDMGGHGTAIPSQTIESGKTVTKPMDPTADGFVFTNWYTEAACRNVYDFSTPVTGNITLYAGWREAKKCAVSFNMNGKTATDVPETQQVEEGKCAVEPAVSPKAEGFKFAGWYKEAECKNHFDFSSPVTADTVVYAKWIEEKTETFTVTFDLNGKTGTAPSAQTVEKDKTATEPGIPKTEGFNFTGWYREKECRTKYDFATPVTADITLYAGWESGEPVIIETGSDWNLYEDASVHEFKIRGINVNGTVANSNAKSKAYYDAKISGSTITVKVTGDRKKAASNAALEFDLGNAGVVEYVLPVSYVKPSFKLSSTTATIKSGTETVLKTTILTKNSDGIFEPYDMTDVKVSGTGLGTVTKAEDGSIEIKTKAAGKGKINIVKDAWDGAKPVSLAYTVKSSKKDVLSVDLQGLKTVVVNSNAKGQVFNFDMMLNGAVPAEGVVKIVDKKNTGLATTGEGGKLLIAYKDGVKNGTYTITLQAGEAKTNVKVKVSGKELDKTVTAKVQTKYDVVTKQGMVIVPSLKDVSGTIEAVSVAESGFIARLNTAGNIVIDYTGNKYNSKNLNIGTLTLSLKLNGIDEPVKLTLNNVKAKKTTPTVKAGTVKIPKDAETAEGKVIGTANIVSTYKVSSGTYKTISPVKTEIVGTPKDVTAKPNESDMTEIDIYSISKKNVSFKVKLTYAGGVTKTVTVKVNKK